MRFSKSSRKDLRWHRYGLTARKPIPASAFASESASATASASGRVLRDRSKLKKPVWHKEGITSIKYEDSDESWDNDPEPPKNYVSPSEVYGYNNNFDTRRFLNDLGNGFYVTSSTPMTPADIEEIVELSRGYMRVENETHSLLANKLERTITCWHACDYEYHHELSWTRPPVKLTVVVDFKLPNTLSMTFIFERL